MGKAGGILVVLNFVLVEYHHLHRNHFSLEVGGHEQGNHVTRKARETVPLHW